MNRLVRDTSPSKQLLRQVTQDQRFHEMVKKVEEASITFETNGVFSSLRFLKHFAIKPSPVVVESLTSYADAMLPYADDREVIPCLTSLASFGPVEATKSILPKIKSRLLDNNLVSSTDSTPLGGIVAACVSFARLGYDPGKDFNEVVMAAATPSLNDLKAHQVLPFFTALKVDARKPPGKDFINSFTRHIASDLVPSLSFELLPELIYKYSDIPGYAPDDNFLDLLNKVSAIAAPKLNTWNSGHMLRCIRAFLYFNYYPPSDIFEAFRQRTERLLVQEWASGKNAMMLTSYFRRLSCRPVGGFPPPGFQ